MNNFTELLRVNYENAPRLKGAIVKYNYWLCAMTEELFPQGRAKFAEPDQKVSYIKGMMNNN